MTQDAADRAAERIVRALSALNSFNWLDFSLEERSERVASVIREEVEKEMQRRFDEQASEVLARHKAKLPEPTLKQAACKHDNWRKLQPQPRHCTDCGLLMWDAGD